MARSEGSSGSPRRDAWRGQGGRRPSAPRPSRDGDRWKRRLPSDADRHFAGEQRRLLVRRLGTTAAAIGLVVALVYLASGFKRQVPLITGVVAEYRPPLGPPVAAEEDRLLLTDSASDRSWFNRSTARPVDVSPVLREADRDQFLEGCGNALAKVSGGGPGNDTAILYVAAIGAVDRHGHACLVPPRTPVGRVADSDAGWLSVDALLDRLDSVRKRPARLLVVLDACRAAHGEPLGILDGSFAAAVAADVRAKPRPGLWVLVSAAPGQTACVHASEGGSVFAIAFHEAVQGRADAAPWGDADGRVELRELASYLGDEVDRRAIIHHGRHQTPFVVPPPPDAAADVPLAWTASRNGRISLAREAPARDQERSDWFAARWKRAEEIRPRGVTERPRGWAEYERLLLRAERLAGSGAAGREELKAVKAAVEAAEKTLGEPIVATEPLPGLRLAALAREISGAAHPNWVAGLEDWSQEVAGTAAPATVVAAPPPFRDADEWLLRAELAWSKMVGLVRSGAVIDVEDWRRWETLVGDPPAAVGVRPIELHAARLLGRWGDGSAWRSAAGTLSRIAILEQDAAAAAFADDVRADALAGALVPRQTADRSRRMAFDLAIVGDETAVTQAAEQARQAAAGYEAAAAVGRDVAAAWRTADDVRAELPWLAAWRAVERGTAADVRGDAEVDVSAIVSGVGKLEKLLTAPTMTAAPGVIDELRAVHVQVAREFDAVRGAFDETCGRLADRSADDASTLAAVRAVLATPLVMGARRTRLLERESALAMLMAGRPVEAAAAAVQPVDPDPAPARAHWAPWKGGFVDPFVAAIVGESAPAVARPASHGDIALAAGAWGQLVRAEAAAALEPAVEGGLAASAVAERRRAVVAPLQDGDATAAASPATGQMLACWRDRLGTAARDAIDDFFAGVERDDTVWFTAAADACLRSAERIEPPVAGDPLEKTRVRLDALATLSQGWAGLSSVPDRLGAAGDQASSLVRSVLRIEPSVADFVPQGDAAVWLLDADESLWLRGQGMDAAVRRVVLPVGRPDATGQPRAADWRVDRTSAAVLAAREGGTLDLTAWFRGHRFVTALPVSSGGNAVPIVWRPAKHLPPRITVRGVDDRQGFVSFIFDCSISMEKRTPGGRPRFDVGREAFAEVLKAMADARRWDASVWLYGHRTKWGKEPPHPPGLSRAGMRQQQAAINVGRPFDLQPGEDVEQVLPMQPLGPGQARSLDGILGELEPAGETPLYLAMRRALAADMTLVPRGEAWRVIAVTDGVNFQLRPPYTTKADVLQTLTEVNRGRAKPVPIDVLALDLKPKPDEMAAFTEMQQLVRESGGQFRDAADIEKLKQAFREFLSLSRWEAAAPQAAIQQAEVGGSLEIEGVDPVAPRALDVRIEGKPATTAQVVVAGGEGLELFAAADGRPLEHRRYDGGTEQGIRDQHDDLPDPRDPRARWFVAGHLPQREGGRTVRFPISIQNGDETKFSPRPVELWAEVRPEGIAGVQPFVFVDLEFEPHRPVPVIDLVVPDWPEGAEAARIGVWFTTQQVEPAAIVLLSELVSGETRSVKDPKMPGVVLEVTLEKVGTDRGRVTVVEQHAGDARDLPRLRVRVEPACERAEHAVALGSGSVRHLFDVALENGKVAAGTKLTVIDRDRFKEQAVGPAAPGGRVEPLRVPVPRE